MMLVKYLLFLSLALVGSTDGEAKPWGTSLAYNGFGHTGYLAYNGLGHAGYTGYTGLGYGGYGYATPLVANPGHGSYWKRDADASRHGYGGRGHSGYRGGYSGGYGGGHGGYRGSY